MTSLVPYFLLLFLTYKLQVLWPFPDIKRYWKRNSFHSSTWPFSWRSKIQKKFSSYWDDWCPLNRRTRHLFACIINLLHKMQFVVLNVQQLVTATDVRIFYKILESSMLYWVWVWVEERTSQVGIFHNIVGSRPLQQISKTRKDKPRIGG